MVPLNVREGGFRAWRSHAALALLLVASLPGCAPATKHEGPAEVRSAIEASNKQFTDAFSRRDAAAIGLLYAEDGEVLPPGATPLDGRDAIVTMWQSVLALPIAGLQRQTTEVGVGEDSAWETGRYTMTAPNGSTSESGKYVVIWKHDEAGWKIYRDIWNSNTPAAVPAPGANPVGP
ncbi:MAG: YybH family protein [Bacteroidota bacterium]